MKAPILYIVVVVLMWTLLLVVACWTPLSPEVLVALVGLASTIAGAALAAAAQFLQFHLSEKARLKADDARKQVLRQMLDCEGWRELDTLKHVIGADEETTKRLLLEIGARASESGKPVWALIERKPLPKYIPTSAQ